jgi:hypothetical protein
MQIRLNGLLHSEDNSAFKVIYPFSLLHLNTVQILQYDGVMMYLFDLHWLGIVVDIEVAIFFLWWLVILQANQLKYVNT